MAQIYFDKFGGIGALGDGVNWGDARNWLAWNGSTYVAYGMVPQDYDVCLLDGPTAPDGIKMYEVDGTTPITTFPSNITLTAYDQVNGQYILYTGDFVISGPISMDFCIVTVAAITTETIVINAPVVLTNNASFYSQTIIVNENIVGITNAGLSATTLLEFNNCNCSFYGDDYELLSSKDFTFNNSVVISDSQLVAYGPDDFLMTNSYLEITISTNSSFYNNGLTFTLNNSTFITPSNISLGSFGAISIFATSIINNSLFKCWQLLLSRWITDCDASSFVLDESSTLDCDGIYIGNVAMTPITFTVPGKLILAGNTLYNENTTLFDPPTVTSASISTSGTTLTVNFAVGTTPVLPAIGVTGFSISGATAPIISGSISGLIGTFTLSNKILIGQTVTLNYTPGNVTSSSSIPSPMVTFTGAAITNNSTQTPSIHVIAIAPNVNSNALQELQIPHVIRHYGKANNSLEKIINPRLQHLPY